MKWVRLQSARGQWASSARCHAKRGDVESPWKSVKHWRGERLSLLTFFAAAKKVSAAPHRGNTRAARRIADASAKAKQPAIADASARAKQNRNRGCQRKGKTKPQSRMPATADKKPTASQTKKQKQKQIRRGLHHRPQLRYGECHRVAHRDPSWLTPTTS
ncbi:hypothetical protein J8I87_17520 [Paraburkholderia sp. LEh10]|uniref:hypothetical protein n=1 Tax=Paraburkholderia sp. LEh10 TaxID=2821353 RepID=UPI001AE70892|nr:hypothetical protein [Paraburkholderia sp. LEh10]MBP0591490.1 hypothetical protein [Paraburkholderia sp. LEh10]